MSSERDILTRRHWLQSAGVTVSGATLGGQKATGTTTSNSLSNHKELRRAWFNVRQNGDITFALEFSSPGNLPSGSEVLSVSADHDGIQTDSNDTGQIGWIEPYDPESPDELNEAVAPDIANGLDRMSERSDERFTIADMTRPEQRITGTIRNAAGVPDPSNEAALSERSVSVPRITYSGPVAESNAPVRLQLISGFIYTFPIVLPDEAVIDSQFRESSLWDAPRPPGRIRNPLASGALVPAFDHRPHPALTILSSAGGVRMSGFSSIGNWAANGGIENLSTDIFDAAAGEIADTLSVLSLGPTDFTFESWVKFITFNVVLPVGGFVLGFLTAGIGTAVVYGAIGLTIGEGLGDVFTLLSANETLGDDLDDTLSDEFTAGQFAEGLVDSLPANTFHYADETPTAAGMAGLAELQQQLVPFFATAWSRRSCYRPRVRLRVRR